MLDVLSIATTGYISSTNRPLSIATDGYISTFVYAVIEVPVPDNITELGIGLKK